MNKIPGWKDADEEILRRQKRIEELKEIAEADRLEKERQAEIERKKAEERAKRIKKDGIISIIVICIVLAAFFFIDGVLIPNKKYNDAIAFISSSDYAKSYELFYDIKGYKDCEVYLSKFSVYYDKVVKEYDDGSLLTINYTYDNKGNLIKEVEGDFTIDYTYDSKGNLTKKVDKYGVATYYTYDNKGNMIRTSTKNRDGSTRTTNYSYDNKGNLIKEVNDKSSTINYTYDNKGNLIKEVHKYGDYDSSTYYYTYSGEHIIYNP